MTSYTVNQSTILSLTTVKVKVLLFNHYKLLCYFIDPADTPDVTGKPPIKDPTMQHYMTPEGHEDNTGGEDEYGASDDESDTNSTTEKDAEPKKPKRTRTAYSNSQLDQLELIFATTHYPDVFTREDLSRRLGIREDRIQVRQL